MRTWHDPHTAICDRADDGAEILCMMECGLTYKATAANNGVLVNLANGETKYISWEDVTLVWAWMYTEEDN